MTASKRPLEFNKKAIILGTKIDDISQPEFLKKIEQFLLSEKPSIIFTPNPEICLKASFDQDYRKIINSANINIPDGFGLKLGAKILGEKLENRLTGSDMVKKILQKFSSQKLRLLIVLRPNSLTQKPDLNKLFQNEFNGWEHSSFIFTTENDENSLFNEINKTEPHFIFLTIGAPKQEELAYKISKYCPESKIIMAVGGSFDFLTNKITRAPQIVRNLGMEWLYRLYQEPKRLPRIKNATIDFLLRVHDWNKQTKTKFRPNVVGLIFNEDGEILIQKSRRFHNHWQFPQGGVDNNETEEEAVFREVEEELSIQKNCLSITQKLPEKNRYISPRYGQLLQGYKGQEQTIFFMKYHDSKKTFNYSSENKEVLEAKFIPMDQLTQIVHKDRLKIWHIAQKYI